MTAISILAGDWEILLDDEKNQNGGTTAIAGMRSIQKLVASPTIVTTQTLYSAVAEAMDDFIAMGFRNGMLPTTPNAFTLPNQYFMPRSSTEFLKEGAITAEYGLTALPDTNGNGVLKVAYSGGTNFDANDIGRRISQADSGPDFGTLLDFDIDPDGTLIAWIRPENSTPVSGDIFDGTGVLQTATADAGTGTSTASVAGISGTTEYAAIQAIGSVPTATEVYIYQNRFNIASSDGTFQWWATDPALSLGIISILIQTKSGGVTIADGDVEVFARKYTALFDNFRLNVVAGGFSALPLASAPDINNTTGYRRSTLSAAANTWEAGNGIYQGATWATATARGVVTVEALGATPDIQYYLVGDVANDLANAVAVKEYDFVTQADGDGTGTAATPIPNVLGPTDVTAGEGGTVTVALGGFSVDHDGDGNVEPYSIQVDCQGDVSIASVYERIKYICSRGQTTDLFTGCNIPGESYRGLDALVEYDGPVGTLVEGDDIVTTTGGNTWTSRLLNQNTTGASLTPAYVTYITVSDQQTSTDSLVNDDSIQDEALDTDVVIVRTDGTIGIENFTSPKSSPFGTFTGTQIFGARGVSFIGITVNPTSYILTDDRGTLNNPPTTVTFKVDNTLALDRVFVARDTGVDGIIDKDQFGGMDTPATTYNGISDEEVRAAGTIDAEVPQAGVVRVVENTLLQEHRYVYSSRTTGLNGVFTLKTASSFTGASDDTGGTTSPTLLNRGAGGGTFVTDGVEPGMLMVDLINVGDFYEIVSVDSETQCTIVQIFGTGGAFAGGDTYEINQLIQNYVTGDDLYDLILDEEATGTSVSNSFTKTPAANFDVVVNVRQGKSILPFTLNQLQQDGSITVTVVRQPDTIAV